MDAELYNAAKEGNVNFLLQNPPTSEHQEGDGGSGTNTHGEKFLSRTNENNNIVHIAARYGHADFICEALERCSVLIDQVNSIGDTPLHVAARFGHLQVVELLVRWYNFPSSQREANRVMGSEAHSTIAGGEVGGGLYEESLSSQPEADRVMETETHSTPAGGEIGEGLAEESLTSPQREEDRVMETRTNSTPVRDREERPSEDILPPLWRVTNLEGTTALHEALRNRKQRVSLYLLWLDPEMACFDSTAGESPLYLAAENLCGEVMERILNSGLPYSVHGPHGQNPLHAAKLCTESSITILLEKRRELVKHADEYGKTPFHYAVEANNCSLIRLLLKFDTSIAYVPDMEGLKPLLRASSLGNWQACEVILQECPDSIESRNRCGQNAVHLFNVQVFMHFDRFRSIPGMRELINERDDQGNTPLHLAMKNREYMKAQWLACAWNARLWAINKEGFTALDLCESDCTLSDQQASMWDFLRDRAAARGRHPNQPISLFGRPMARNNQSEGDRKKEVNTLSVLAVLLASVTFTAAFTMPGGFNSSGDNLGVAVLIRKAAVQVFVLSDAFAMCCSVSVLFLLLWAMVVGPDVSCGLTKFSLALLRVALYGTLVAFVSGLYAVTAPEALWVAILVVVMGSLVPLTTSRNMVVFNWLLAWVLCSRNGRPKASRV